MQRLGELWKAIKFAIVGVANTLIDMGLFTLLTQVLGADPYLAQVCSFGAGMLNSYVFNRSWTFKTSQGFFSPTLWRFLLTNLAMLLLSTGILWLGMERLGLHELVAKGISIAVTLVVNFVINRLWVFSS